MVIYRGNKVPSVKEKFGTAKFVISANASGNDLLLALKRRFGLKDLQIRVAEMVEDEAPDITVVAKVKKAPTAKKSADKKG